MTEGVPGPPANVAGPPELRHFTAAFNRMSQVVRASLERQRRLVADASHQLRNPLAAVRLRADTLEESVTESGTSTYDSMTAELDRLENLLHQLLRLARAEEDQRQPQSRSVHGDRLDRPCRRHRRVHQFLAAGCRSAQSNSCTTGVHNLVPSSSWPATMSSSCSTSPSTMVSVMPGSSPPSCVNRGHGRGRRAGRQRRWSGLGRSRSVEGCHPILAGPT